MTNYWLDLCLKDEYKKEVLKELQIMVGIRYVDYNYMMNAYKYIMSNFDKNYPKYKRISNQVQIRILYSSSDDDYVSISDFDVLFLR